MRNKTAAAATAAIITTAAPIMRSVSVEVPLPGSTIAEGDAIGEVVVGAEVGVEVGSEVGLMVGDGAVAAGLAPRTVVA